jgi:hypothetical protein
MRIKKQTIKTMLTIVILLFCGKGFAQKLSGTSDYLTLAIPTLDSIRNANIHENDMLNIRYYDIHASFLIQEMDWAVEYIDMLTQDTSKLNKKSLTLKKSHLDWKKYYQSAIAFGYKRIDKDDISDVPSMSSYYTLKYALVLQRCAIISDYTYAPTAPNALNDALDCKTPNLFLEKINTAKKRLLTDSTINTKTFIKILQLQQAYYEIIGFYDLHLHIDNQYTPWIAQIICTKQQWIKAAILQSLDGFGTDKNSKLNSLKYKIELEKRCLNLLADKADSLRNLCKN